MTMQLSLTQAKPRILLDTVIENWLINLRCEVRVGTGIRAAPLAAIVNIGMTHNLDRGGCQGTFEIRKEECCLENRELRDMTSLRSHPPPHDPSIFCIDVLLSYETTKRVIGCTIDSPRSSWNTNHLFTSGRPTWVLRDHFTRIWTRAYAQNPHLHAQH